MAMIAFATAGAALEIISAIPGTIEVVKMFENILAPPFEGNQDTLVRVHLGSQADKDDINNLGGDIPGVALWDMNGSLIGNKGGQHRKLRQGAFEDIKITAREEIGNVQAHYLGVSSGGIDAVCIAGITVTFPDGARTGWTGNIAKVCDAPWANSQTPLAQSISGGSEPTSDCVWLDSDGSNGLPFQGLGVHLPSFGLANQNLATSYAEDKRLMCKSGPRFRMYDKLTADDPVLVFPKPPKFLISGDPGVDDTNKGLDADPGFIIENPGIDADRPGKKKRSVATTDIRDEYSTLFGLTHPWSSKGGLRGRAQPSWGRRWLNSITNSTNNTPAAAPARDPMYGKVIVSPHNYNSARRLCESESSWGHSFVSLPEGLFCDMQDKTLYFTCDNKEAPNSNSCCYDTEQDNLLPCPPESNKRDSITNFHRPISSLLFDIDGGAMTQGMAEGKNFTNVKHW